MGKREKFTPSDATDAGRPRIKIPGHYADQALCSTHPPYPALPFQNHTHKWQLI